MDNKLLEEIDDLLSRLEDFTHGDDGYKITKLRAKIANHDSFKIKIRVKEIKYGLSMTKESNNINKISTFCKKCQAIICECETNKSAEIKQFLSQQGIGTGTNITIGLMVDAIRKFSASENARLIEENEMLKELNFEQANHFYRIGRFETKDGQIEKHYEQFIESLTQKKN